MISNLKELQNTFEKNNMTSRVILPNALLPGAEYLISPFFSSSNHIPFFYLLGSCLDQVGKVLCVEPDYGLELASFMRGCKGKEVVGIGKTQFSFALKNAMAVGVSLEMVDELPEVQFDVALILGVREWPKSRDLLIRVWESMSDNSLLIVDYIKTESVGRGWVDFQAVVNRQGVVYQTRHGTGVIKR